MPKQLKQLNDKKYEYEQISSALRSYCRDIKARPDITEFSVNSALTRYYVKGNIARCVNWGIRLIQLLMLILNEE